MEYPPPVAPLNSWPWLLARAQVGSVFSQSFHTVWAPTPEFGRVVPPALMTSGCEPGSSTARFVSKAGMPPLATAEKQSVEPASPDAAIIVWPCRAMRWKIWLSVLRSPADRAASQLPQLVVTTCAASSLAMWLKRSNAWASFSFGAS